MMRFVTGQRKFFFRLLVAVGISYLCLLPYVMQARDMPDELFVLFVLGGASFTTDAFPPLVMMGLLPTLLLCYFLSDYLADDLGKTAVYLFTRKESRTKWLLRKMATLYCATLLFCVSTLVLLICTRRLVGYDSTMAGSFPDILEVFVSCVLLNAGVAFVLLAAVHILALWLGSLRAFLVISFIHLLSVFMCISLVGEMQSVAAHVLPSAQGYYAWHEAGVLAEGGAYGFLGCRPIEHFSLTYSLGYLVVLGVFEVWLGSYAIDRVDLI